MGSTDSIPQNNSLRINRDNWESFLSDDPQPLSFVQGGYKRIKNKMTGEELDQYSLTFTDQDDYQNYLEILTFRNKSQSLVKVAYINQEKVNQFCSLIANLQVYIEHFPLRLCDVQAVPFPQNLYVLARALQGFKYLYSQFGHFHITQDLICINQQGIVKVWINSNLSNSSVQSFNNDAQYNRFLRKVEAGSQNSMIWQLLTIVDQITNPLSLPQNTSFIAYLGKLNKSHLSFQSAQRLIISYARYFRATIPQVFQSTLKVMREKKGIFDSEIDLTVHKVNEQVDFTLIGNRFKQSTVQRVESVKNNSVRSYAASESNRTFADKLKKYDNQFKNMNNQFGKSSYMKDSPLQASAIILQKKQSLTERNPILNQKSSSSVEFPLTNSFIAFGSPKELVGNLAFPISNSSSEIISQKKNILTLSDSPSISKPLTYFSQYIDQTQQTKIAKKATLFSFGVNDDDIQVNKQKNQVANKAFRQVVISQSLENSKTDLQRNSSKPAITFTYNKQMLPKSSSNQNLLNYQAQSNRSSYADSQKNQESFDELSSMPFSPPSVDKRSSYFQHAKASADINFDKDEKKDGQNRALSLFKKRDYAQQVVESVCEKVNCSQSMLDNLHLEHQRPQILIHSAKQNIHNFTQEYNPHNYRKQQSISKSFLEANKNQRLKNLIPQKNFKDKKNQISIFQEHLLMKKKQLLQIEQKSSLQDERNASSLYQQYHIDPDIIFDLLNLQKQKVKKK